MSLKTINYEYTSNPGNRIQPVFTRIYDEDLKKEYVRKTGEIDIYQEIQESDNTSDITLLKKMIKGDPNMAPADNTAVFSDSALFPKTIHDLYDADNQAKANYEKLPDSAKKIFPNVNSFISALHDGTYYDKLVAGYQAQAAAAVEAAKIAAAEKIEKGDE